MELEEQSGIDTWRGAAGERGAFFCWRRSVSAGGRCFSEEGESFFVGFFFWEL